MHSPQLFARHGERCVDFARARARRVDLALSMRMRAAERTPDHYNLKKSGFELSENSRCIRCNIEEKSHGKSNDSFNPGC
jgi:hypothetical protein